MDINLHTPNSQLVKEEITREIREYFEMNGNKSMTYQKLWDTFEELLLFSTVAAIFSIPTSNVLGFQLLHTLTNTCYYLSFEGSHPVGVKWCHTVELIRIALMTNDTEHVSMCLSGICKSSLDKVYSDPSLIL